MNSAVPPKIYEILKKAVNGGDIDNFTVSVHDPNKKGEGYLGQMFFISLQDNNNGKQLHFVVKQAFPETNIREFYPIRDAFVNEIYFYTKLWPKFSKFQERVAPVYRFCNLAKCLAAISEVSSERLVFENLKYQGFVLHDKRIPLDKAMYELIFKIYGKFHAVSFAYKALNPEEFSEIAKGALNIWKTFCDIPSFYTSIKLSNEQSLDSLQPGVDDAVIEKFRHYVDDGVEIFRNSLVKGKYSSIIHGDCWSNNMMFKYDEFGDIADVKFLDFQIFQVGSPACDLSYCLYSGGTKEIFDDLDQLLQVYHDSLSDSLRAYGCDPNDLYPLEALKDDWKQYCQLGVTMGLMIWRGKMTYEEEAVDLTDLSENGEEDIKKFFDSKYDTVHFKQRTRDVLLHLYEKNYMV